MTSIIRPYQAVGPYPYILAAMGDSFTRNDTMGVNGHDFHPNRTAAALNALGCYVRPYNYGISGNTTTQMLSRFASMTSQGVPKLAVVMGSINDLNASIPDTTTISNLTAMVNSLIASGCPRIVMPTTHYLNFSNVYGSAGDTLATPQATYVELRRRQGIAFAAVNAANPGKIILCDLYSWFRNLIVNGTYTQGDHLWHIADGNAHLNVIGEQIIGDAVVSAIQTQKPQWITDLANPNLAA